MRPITYITLDIVLAIHDDLIERYGGSHGIRDLGLLQSALARPQASFASEDLYPTVLDKAVALFHSLMFNHAFIDSNKRTTITTTARFLYVNGYDFRVTNEEFVNFPLLVENQKLPIEKIAEWLQSHTQKTTT